VLWTGNSSHKVFEQVSSIKNKLYKRWSPAKNENDASKYKTFRATFKKGLTEAKNEHEQFSAKSNSIKQLWANLKLI
jgi:hypothetical protein